MLHTPFNMAESIFELFTDPRMKALEYWEVETGREHGLVLTQKWAWLQVDWARRPSKGPVLRMRRPFRVDCSGYDHIMISLMAPQHTILRMKAETDRGSLDFESPPFGLLKSEFYMPLQGAREIRSVTLELEAGFEGTGTAWFNWLGLHQSALLERYEAGWKRFDEEWEMYLKPADYEPRFEPQLGVVLSREELAAVRKKHDQYLKLHGDSPFTRLADEAKRLVPEQMIGEYVNFWNDTRYTRNRDYGKHLLTHGPNAAVAGMLLQDKELSRLGARYAMSIAMCGKWDSGFICNLPGSPWEHRSFVQSLCMHETAFILDLAGEWFTELGREYILRRIAEEGQGNIHFNVWKFEYIFHCNQISWFSPGRMLGYALLEPEQPRSKPYADLGYKDLLESLESTILPDGGYVEGPGYFTFTAKTACQSIYYYARSRGLEFRSLLPERLRQSSRLAEVLVSTDDRYPMIMICDAINIPIDAAAYLAYLLPDSQWVTVYRKLAEQVGGIPDAVIPYCLEAEIPLQGPPPKPFCSMPDMGLLSSVRVLDGQLVKLMVMGNRAGAGHAHEDKGSFVLEFAGDTFAMDFGSCDYSHPAAELLKHAQRHNMLVPIGMEERAHPQNPIMQDVKPNGCGDESCFHASIDVTAGWEGYYRRWVRRWTSDRPELLTITDEYELERGDGVEFIWTTRLPVEVDGRTLRIKGKRGTAVLEVPEECTVRIDRLPLIEDEYQSVIRQRADWRYGTLELGAVQPRIVIRKMGQSGTLSVKVNLDGTGEVIE